MPMIFLVYIYIESGHAIRHTGDYVNRIGNCRAIRTIHILRVINLNAYTTAMHLSSDNSKNKNRLQIKGILNEKVFTTFVKRKMEFLNLSVSRYSPTNSKK